MNREEVKEIFCKPSDERALLCYAINRMDNFYTICSKIDENDFLSHDHKTIYVILKTLLNKKVEKFDVSMVAAEADNNGVLKSIGGIEYIESIRSMPVEDVNLDVYTRNVLENSTKYKLYTDLQNSLRKIAGSDKSGLTSEDLIGLVENKVMDLATRSKAISEPRDFGDGLIKYIDERRDNPVEMSGISTGFPILDLQIDGLVPGTLHIISARKKMGKSTFLSNVAAHVAYRSGIPVLYVDTEMSFGEWRDRVIAMLTGVEERIVKHGGYTKNHYQQIKDGLKIVKKGHLFHERMPGYSVDKLTALYKKYKIKEDIGLAVFDYLKEPDSASTDRKRKEWQILGDVTTRMKDLAGILDIPFMTAVQLNRGMDVAGSDRISWFADIIMQWGYKEKEEMEAGGEEGGQFKLIIKDTRRGGGTPEEGIGYKFKKRKLLIKEVPIQDQLIPYGQEVINYGSDDEEKLG